MIHSTENSSRIPLSIWALGAVSFLMKISSVIVFSLSPLFITQVLGASAFALGILEGIIETFSLFTRIFSGILSDYIRKRKAIIVVGYGLAILSRPLLGLATGIGGVFLGRALDRIGNGLDATPRDALVGDLAPPQIKGACYGLRESLSRSGALTGSLVAIGLLWLTQNNYSLVFWLGTIPTAMALVVLILFVKDAPPKKDLPQTKETWKLKDIRKLTLSFWLVLLLGGLFMISNFSGAFLILRAEQTGLDIHLVPLVMVIQNISTALTAYPVGYLSDKMGRRTMMVCGILLVILSNILLAEGGSILVVFLGIFLWGAEMGITTSILAALLADSCPQQVRGTGFGLFHLNNGLCFLLANTLAGWLWSQYSPSIMFYTSASIAALSACVLPVIHKQKN